MTFKNSGGLYDLSWHSTILKEGVVISGLLLVKFSWAMPRLIPYKVMHQAAKDSNTVSTISLPTC